MSFCKNCGIEIETAKTQCPLCDGLLTADKLTAEACRELREKQPYPADEPAKQQKITWTNRQKRLFSWELLSLATVIAGAVVLSIYFLYKEQGTWVYFTLAALASAWLGITIPLLLSQHFILTTLGEILTIMGFLAVLDLQDGNINWFGKLALPTLILVALIIHTVVYTSRKAKVKGANIAGFILLGISAITSGINIIISTFLHKEQLITWSVFVIIPATALAVFLFYIHYRLAKLVDINKRFKI